MVSTFPMTPKWLHPPHNPVLGPGEVHVWMAGLNASSSDIWRDAQLLSPEEHARAARFIYEADRLRYIVGRSMLRSVLGRYLALDPRAIRIGYGSHGKPELAEPSHLRFNLAHSANLVLYAFTLNAALGIDVECIRGDIEGTLIAEQFFTPTECAALRALPENEQLEAFFRCWTRKEAFVKANGLGLSFDLDEFEVSLKADEPSALLSVRGDAACASRWTMHSFLPADGFVATVAVNEPRDSFEYFSAQEF